MPHYAARCASAAAALGSAATSVHRSHCAGQVVNNVSPLPVKLYPVEVGTSRQLPPMHRD